MFPALRVRQALRRAALSLTVLLPAGAAHAQDPTVLYANGGTWARDRLLDFEQSQSKFAPGGNLGLHSSTGVSGAAVVANTAKGKFGAYATTSDFAGIARGRVWGTAQLMFERKATAYTHPLELHVDGDAYLPTRPDGYRYARMGASLKAYEGPAEYGVPLARVSASKWAGDTGRVAYTESQVAKFTIPAYTGPGTAWFSVYLFYDLDVVASGGGSADYSQTGSIFVPMIEGVRWKAAGDFLTLQSRPSWVTTPRHPGEITPGDPITTTPEPSTFVLTAGGLAVATFGARRRRRAQDAAV